MRRGQGLEALVADLLVDRIEVGCPADPVAVFIWYVINVRLLQIIEIHATFRKFCVEGSFNWKENSEG